jgi:hypothetical protein
MKGVPSDIPSVGTEFNSVPTDDTLQLMIFCY